LLGEGEFFDRLNDGFCLGISRDRAAAGVGRRGSQRRNGVGRRPGQVAVGSISARYVSGAARRASTAAAQGFVLMPLEEAG